MNEFKLEKGHIGTGIQTSWPLVSANMGDGYHQFDEPRTAANLLEQRFLRVAKEVAWDMYQAENNPNHVRDLDKFEESKTLRLELAWLQRDQDMMRRILSG